MQKRNKLFAELPIITFHLLLKKQQARTAPLYAPAGLLLSYRRFDSRKDFLMSYTKLDLLQDLADMGLTGQETILIHSSMKSIGPVDGGADTVLDALMEFFRPGLLLLPTHTWRTINAANPVFDVCTSPCCVGILPELFRQRPGVVRSLHPTHSMAGYGQQAVSYLAGEELRNTPCTPGGCYDRLKDVGGKILLVGVTHARNTYMVLTVPGPCPNLA